jgi:hypothetical protein
MAHQEVMAKFAFGFNATAANAPVAERQRHRRAGKTGEKS